MAAAAWAVVVKAGVEERLHDVGHRERDATAVRTPLKLVHEPTADGVEVLEQVTNDQVHREALIQTPPIHIITHLNARADVLKQPGAQRIQLLRVVRLLLKHIGQKLHIKAGNLQAEGPSRRNDVGEGGLHPHGVVAENDHAPAPDRLPRHGGMRPIDQALRCRGGHLGVLTCVGPGAHVDVNEPAILRERAVRRMRQNDARLRTAIPACQVQGRLLRELADQGDEAQLGEGPRVWYAHKDIDALGMELPCDNIGLPLAIHKDGGIDDRHRGAIG